MRQIEITKPGELDYNAREALNRLRVNFSFCGDQYKKIVVTSSIPSEGKSFIAMHLSMMLAEAGYKVILVDADIRKSQLRTSFGIKTYEEDPAGLPQYLAGKAKMDDVVYDTNYNNLFVVPAFRTVANAAILFQSERFPALLDSLAQIVDYVIVDTPPIADVSDGELVSSHCDGALVVIRNGVTPRGLIASTLKQIESAGCTLMGVVLNRVNIEKNSYYYGKYYYGKKYHYYSKYYGGYYRDDKPKGKGKKK